MQEVVLLKDIAKYLTHMEKDISQYIVDGQIEGFENFENFAFLAFDYYDFRSNRKKVDRIVSYIDRDDLFFICENEVAYQYCFQTVEYLKKNSAISNDDLLYRFFGMMLQGDMEHLDTFEDHLNKTIDDLLIGKAKNVTRNIMARRQELLRLKHYYEQIDTIFDEISMSDNSPLSEASSKKIRILGSRTDRYLKKIENLQAILSQVGDTYQSQLANQQNELMKFFTVVAAIFLPLTLLTGWYGMNFKIMPELEWEYGYPVILAVASLLIVGQIVYFKHKKWL